MHVDPTRRKKKTNFFNSPANVVPELRKRPESVALFRESAQHVLDEA